MTKVIVVVSGGVVQSAYANEELAPFVEIEVLDLDDVEAEGGDPDAAMAVVDAKYDPVY